MLAKAHSMSGAAAWLTAAAVGVPFASDSSSLAVLALGTAVCAGAAIAADIDSHSSTIVNAFGIAGKAVYEFTNTISLAVYNLTRTKYDQPKENGHRTLTHTGVFAILMGLLASALSMLPGTVSILGKPFASGQLFSLIIMGIFLHLSLAGLFDKQIKKARKRYGVYTLMAVSALLTVITAKFLPTHATFGWLGFAVAGGWLMHILGDLITKMGVPVLMPLKIRGKRWYGVSTPSFLRITAGGVFEHAVILPVLTVVAIVAACAQVPAFSGVSDAVLGFVGF